jgi:predicted enzyme related to lactoylglutathione lyase
MSSKWWSVVVDSTDPQTLGRWWAEVLGYRVIYDSPGEVVVVEGGAEDPKWPGLVFVRVMEVKTRRNRLHLDLNPEDLEAEVARLEALGARRAGAGRPDVPWTVLSDPEGNEFCVLTPRRQG